MSDFEITHDRFTIEKAYDCNVGDLFSAFADAARKEAWYAESPTHEKLEYRLDFTRGGREVLRAKMLASTPIAGAVLQWSSEYAEIQPDNRIVFYQTTDLDGRCISSAVITLEFSDNAGGSRLAVTHQAAFFEGSDGPEMRKMGWEFLLAAMEATLPVQ